MRIDIGVVLEGKVTGITNFGAFVTLPDGGTGMIHISEISTKYVKDIREFLEDGQQVKVKVINIDERGKVALSIKRVLEDEEKSKKDNGNSPPSEYIAPMGRRRAAPPDSFEDMMSRFKADSDEKISDLKKSTDAKRGGGFSRKNSGRYN